MSRITRARFDDLKVGDWLTGTHGVFEVVAVTDCYYGGENLGRAYVEADEVKTFHADGTYELEGKPHILNFLDMGRYEI